MELLRGVIDYFTEPFSLQSSAEGPASSHYISASARLKYRADSLVWMSIVALVVFCFNFVNFRLIARRPTEQIDMFWFFVFVSLFSLCPILLRFTQSLFVSSLLWSFSVIATGEVFYRLGDVPELELNPCIFMMAVPLFVSLVEARCVAPSAVLVCFLQRRWITHSTAYKLSVELGATDIQMSLQTLAFFFNVFSVAVAGFGWYNTRLHTRIVNGVNKLWQESEQSKEMFVSCISHELRNPLQTIIGCVQLLAKEPTVQDTPTMSTLTSCCQLLHAIINDVLDLTKLDAARLSLEHIPFDPLQMLKDVITMTRVKVKPNVTVTFHAVPGIPATIIGDKARIAQVCVNLLSNAMKFTDEGAITVTASVVPSSSSSSSSSTSSSSSSSSRFTVSVQDTGIGISADAQKKIFQPFTQSDSSITRRFGGTGLGLYLSKRLVNLMNGSLTCSSRLYEGSRFTFSIPCQYEEDSSSKQGTSGSVTNGTGNILNPPIRVSLDVIWVQWKRSARVLIVDDMEYSQFVLEQMLRKLLGFNDVTACSNGLQALQLLTDQNASTVRPFDLVISDLQMPFMDGLTFVTKLREFELKMELVRRTPVVILTGNSTQADRNRCQAGHVDDFLLKPIRSADLDIALMAVCCKPQ